MNVEDIKNYVDYYKGNIFPYRKCIIKTLTYGTVKDIRCYDCGCNYCISLSRKYIMMI